MSAAGLRILFLPRYEQRAASSRLRCYHYIDALEQAGITAEISPLLSDSYIRAVHAKTKINHVEILISYLRRFRTLFRSRLYDVLWVEKEALPWLPAWVEKAVFRLAGVKVVLDYDDAVFHAYDTSPHWFVRATLGRKIDRLMSFAELVVVGNGYLSNRARESKTRTIAQLPTVVDVGRYAARPKNPDQDFFTIGWIGSPLTSGYLELVRPALVELTKRLPLKIVVIGGAPSALTGLPVEHRIWSVETEAEEIAQFDVGIMPLFDGLWERGKCGYKLIQYMASWLPAVASPVGANVQIVEPGVTGFLADSQDDWVDALLGLWQDRDLRRKMGVAGRRRVEERYSLQIAAPELIRLLRQTADVVGNRTDAGGWDVALNASAPAALPCKPP